MTQTPPPRFGAHPVCNPDGSPIGTLAGEVEVKNDSGNPVPVAPNVARGTGPVNADTTRVTLAEGGPLILATGGPADAAATSDTGTFSLIALSKRWLQSFALFGTGTRAYDFTNGLRQAFTSTSTAAIPLPALGASREVMFHASQRCFIRFGDNAVLAAAVAAGHLVLEDKDRFHLRIPVGTTHFTVIRDTTDGNLNVTAVL